jgi:hypothetical protein
MKQFRFPITIFATALFCFGAASAQTGFPFQNESLRYNINYPSGLSLGDATMTASKGASGWNFEVTLDAGVPGFAIRDKYRSSTEGDLCSTQLERETSHGSKKTREKTAFDQKKGTARRTTTLPENGGFTDFDIRRAPRMPLLLSTWPAARWDKAGSLRRTKCSSARRIRCGWSTPAR